LHYLFYCSPGPYSQNLIPYLDNGLYGYADISGKVLIKPQFDEVTWFDSTGMADVRYGSHWSVINEAGNVLVPFESSQPVTFKNVYSLSHSGTSFYDKPEDTLRNLRLVQLDSIYFRFLNTSNNRFSSIFSSAGSMRFENEGIHVTFTNGIFTGILADQSVEIIDTNFTVLLKTKEQPSILNDHLMAIRENNTTILFDYHTFQKTKLPFLQVHQIIKDSLLIVSDTAKYRPYRWVESAKGISDMKGNLVLPLEYYSFNYKAGNLLVKFIPDKGSQFIDFKGHPVDTTIYSGINFQCDSLYQVTTTAHKSILLDFHARPLTKAYDKLTSNWQCRTFQFKDGSFAGILDSNFIESIRIEADEVNFSYGDDPFVIKKNSKYGLANKAGKIIIPPIYDGFYQFNPDYIRVTLNKKMGLISEDGKVIFEPIYDDVGGFGTPEKVYFTTRVNNFSRLYDDHFIMIKDSISGDVKVRNVNISRRNGLTFLTDSRGILITEPAKKYSAAVVYSDTTWIHIVTRDNFLEIINEDGLIISNDSIRLENDLNKRSYAGGLFAVRIGDQEGVINHKGCGYSNPLTRKSWR
jgi:hypothetical protein